MNITDLPERMQTKIRVVESGCWQWIAARSDTGYGQFHPPGASRGRVKSAHRFSYEHLVGPIPEGLHIDHLCRNRACVNPQHMEPVTNRTNIARGKSVNAETVMARLLTGRCSAGHDDWVVMKDGHYCCQTCLKERGRERSRTLSQAARSLGLTQAQYRAAHGSSLVAARAILDSAAPA